MRRFLSFTLVAILAAGFPVARAADLMTEKERRAGRKLYLTQCARCHKLYDPAVYANDEWRDWLAKMSRKAKLKPNQTDLLSRYLETLRSSTNQPPVIR